MMASIAQESPPWWQRVSAMEAIPTWQSSSYATAGPEAQFGLAQGSYSEMDVAKVPPPSWVTSYGGPVVPNQYVHNEYGGQVMPGQLAHIRAPPGLTQSAEMIAVPAWTQPVEKEDSEGASTASGKSSLHDVDPVAVQPTSSLLPEEESVTFEMIPSKGSAGHAQGKCKPCHYMNSKVGCAQGENCGFCHIRHQKRNKQGVPRTERHQCLTLVQAVYDAGFKKGEGLVNSESRLAAFLQAHPKMDTYAAAVLRSLRRGAVLHGIDTSI